MRISRRAAAWIPALWLVAAPAPASTDRYEIHWGPLLVADGQLAWASDEGGRRMTLDVQTRSVLDWIYRLTYRAEAELEGDGRSRTTRLVRDRNGRKKETSMRWLADEIRVTERKTRPGRDPRSKEVRFSREASLVGPFSFLHLASALDWSPGVERSFDVVTGEDRWRVELRCAGRRMVPVGAGERAAWELVARATELAPDDGEPPETLGGDGWIHDVTFLVAADDEPGILELRIGTRVGLVRAHLLADPPPATASENGDTPAVSAAPAAD